MSSIAIITARGGSKRILKKNIRDFCGKPIISYSIKAAINSNVFDEVMVSTDDEAIASISKEYGAKVPFMRSKKNSDDFATTSDVLIEVLSEYQKIGINIEHFCCIYPTAPLISEDDISQAMSLLISSGADSVIPVVKFSFPPQRGVFIRDGKLTAVDPLQHKKRSQDLEPIFHDCGLFYCVSYEPFLHEKKLITTNTIPFLMDEGKVQDIDTLEDWKIAEMKYKILRIKNESF
ncbi:MAG TPA: pseudaminic acid cytidylyltransferase [Lachnospiraceae bacterium]|nr:pseudaminic acid cytidylyltransferase [Lachnospiraceae bacterium]